MAPKRCQIRSPPAKRKRTQYNGGGDATGARLKPSEVKEDLRSRFANCRVEVHIPLNLPKRVYVINRIQNAVDETVEEEILYNVKHSDTTLHQVTQYDKKWSSDGNIEDTAIAKRLNLFLNVLKVQGRLWQYDSKKRTWRNMAATQGQGQQGQQSQGDGFEENDANLTALEFILKDKFERSLEYALIDKMVNSMGRNFVNDMMTGALFVFFGEKYVHFVDGMGKEGFAVSSKEAPADPLAEIEESSPTKNVKAWVQSSSINQSPRTPRQKSKKAKSGATSPDSSVAVSPSGSSVTSVGVISSDISQMSSTASSRCKNYVYTDYVLVSVKHRPAVYLLVVEIKSKPLTDVYMAQLYGEMIGAGMHQNEVFGLVLNAQEARMIRMSIDHEAKMIKFSSPWVCEFVDSVSDMCDLFRSLLAVIEYASSHIVGIKH